MARLFITLYLGVLGSIFAFIFALNQIVVNYFYEIGTADSRQQIQSYIELFHDIHRLAGTDEMMKSMKRTADIYELIVLDVQDPKVLSDPKIQSLPSPGILLESLDPEDDEAAYFKLAVDDRVFQISPDRDSELWQIEETLSQISLWGIFLVVALIIGAWFYFFQRKLKLLEISALSIADGNFSTRAPMEGRYRIGNLNKAFNQMAEKVEQLIASHKRLTNAVAHELRTPIFRLRCQLELLQLGDVDPKEQKKFIDGMEEDLVELDLMVDELLSYARMERAEMPANIEPQSLTQWLQEQQKLLQRSCHHPLTLELTTPVTADFDPHLLQRALTNLIRNADRYAEQSIILRVDTLKSATLIYVDDDGCGIPEQDRERVLQPFERLDTARNRQTGGHGLGLSIVKEIMAVHGGTIQISESPEQGARIALSLPNQSM